MRERIARFMAGRNGNDQFNMFLLITGLVLAVVSSFLKNTVVGGIMTVLVLALLGFCYFRMLSKNVYKRAGENGAYLRKKEAVKKFFRCQKERWVQRKEYKFFNCPKCRAMLRVPRGRGKIKIMCRKCGNSFIGKT